jgi:hypothetical protein
MRLDTPDYHSEKMRKEARRKVLLEKASKTASIQEEVEETLNEEKEIQEEQESKTTRKDFSDSLRGLDLTLVSTASFLVSHCMRSINDLLSIEQFDKIKQEPVRSLEVKRDYWAIRSKLTSVISILDTVVANLLSERGEKDGD